MLEMAPIVESIFHFSEEMNWTVGNEVKLRESLSTYRWLLGLRRLAKIDCALRGAVALIWS